MDSFKGTPGPWELSGPFGTNDYDYSEGFYNIRACHTLSLKVERDGEGFVEGQNTANACLIAAAPNLLEALEKLRERAWFIIGVNDPTIVAADAAIAKALQS